MDDRGHRADVNGSTDALTHRDRKTGAIAESARVSGCIGGWCVRRYVRSGSPSTPRPGVPLMWGYVAPRPSVSRGR